MRVELERVTRRFGKLTALRAVTCNIPSGRRLALIGPNGSGKSTLNRILLGLLCYEGEVRLDGCSARADRLEVARRIAYVPQTAPNLGAPVRELVAALGRLRDVPSARVAGLAARLGLDLEAVARRPFRSLSGGMKQKLLLAQALSCDASLLVLDEPTGSLDAQSRERFFELFEELREDVTLILCSHRLEEVRQLVDHVLALHEGSVAYSGPAESFLAGFSTGVIEVRAERAAHGWLDEHGFRPGAGGWWVRVTSRSEKRDLLAKLSVELGPALEDVNARDLEWLHHREPEDDDASS